MLEPYVSLPGDERASLTCAGAGLALTGAVIGCFGGGFYDRFLASRYSLPSRLVSTVLIVEHVPNGGFDQRVDYVASESGISARPIIKLS